MCIRDSRGCVHDIRNVNRLLVDTFGFDAKTQIKLHQNEEVVLSAITDGFKWLFDGAGEGDRLVFHFSGHGSYLPSESTDEPVDELLCLWDMDWDDGDTYLIDDDLGKFTEGLPEGAHLTIVLDCCNSGTGTKAIAGGRSFRPTKSTDSKSRLIIEADSIKSAPSTSRSNVRSKLADSNSSFRPNQEFRPVFARFVHPPQDLQLQTRRSVRSLGKSLSDQNLNHTLLAAAKDTQTAADAFIDAKYQGAFSYFLCHTARSLGVAAPVDSIMSKASKEISSAGYSQIPQLEGIGLDQRLFGGEADKSHLPAPVVSTSPKPSATITAVSPASSDRMQVLSQLMNLQERFFDLSNSILGQPTLSQRDGIATRSTTEAIVYVHGISQHTTGYSDAWFASMSPHLSRSIPKQEVLWSDLVNPRSATRMEITESSEGAQELRSAIQDELDRRMGTD